MRVLTFVIFVPTYVVKQVPFKGVSSNFTDIEIKIHLAHILGILVKSNPELEII